MSEAASVTCDELKMLDGERVLNIFNVLALIPVQGADFDFDTGKPKTHRNVQGKLVITKHRLVFLCAQDSSEKLKVYLEMDILAVDTVEPSANAVSLLNYFSLSKEPEGSQLEICSHTFHRLTLVVAQTVAEAIQSGIRRAMAKRDYLLWRQDSGQTVCTDYTEQIREDYNRLELNDGTHYRISDVNATYQICSSYPSCIVCPAKVPDSDLVKSAQFRRQGRLPAIVWRLPKIEGLDMPRAVIARAAQPTVGLSGRARSDEDEALVDAIRMGAYQHHRSSTELDSPPTSPESDALCIFDARSRPAALANNVRGGGVESSAYYRECNVVHLNIDNIHAMRDSLKLVKSMLRSDKDTVESLDSKLTGSKWRFHISIILQGLQQVMVLVSKGVSVLVHCSDGWDRTSQLTSLSQLCLDPHYRTIDGFILLIEKEWLSFGHRFYDRLLTQDSEQSPVFLQFLDCVWQLMNQNPSSFEFTEDMLMTIHAHSYSLRFGTFYGNNQQSRKEHSYGKHNSLWGYLHAHRKQFLNPAFLQQRISELSNPQAAPPNSTAPARPLYPMALRLRVDARPSAIKLWDRHYLRMFDHTQHSHTSVESDAMSEGATCLPVCVSATYFPHSLSTADSEIQLRAIAELERYRAQLHVFHGPHRFLPNPGIRSPYGQNNPFFLSFNNTSSPSRAAPVPSTPVSHITGTSIDTAGSLVVVNHSEQSPGSTEGWESGEDLEEQPRPQHTLQDYMSSLCEEYNGETWQPDGAMTDQWFALSVCAPRETPSNGVSRVHSVN